MKALLILCYPLSLLVRTFILFSSLVEWLWLRSTKESGQATGARDRLFHTTDNFFKL